MSNAKQIDNLGLAFQQVVEAYPENLALHNDEIKLTYKKLNNKANLLVNHLIKLGVREKNIICIPAHKNELSFVLIVACLKLGVCYTFYDVEVPLERLQKIVNNSSPCLLVLPGGERERLFRKISGRFLFATQHDLSAVINADQNAENPEEARRATGDHPAYIMYTSGSTEEPKGVLIRHSQVLSFISWSIDTFEFNAKDVLTNINPLYFDNSIFDYYSALFSGATLTPIHKEQAQFPQLMLEILRKYHCTSWYSVPSLLMYYQSLKFFDGLDFFAIKKVIFGGEGFPLAKLKKLYDPYRSNIKFFNVYGPTECTCMCSAYLLKDEDFDSDSQFPPLGKIAENFSYLIVDEDFNQVPAGNIGELCLLGGNVSSGYFNDSVRTSIHFIQNPFNTSSKEILYKTGDLVCWNDEKQKLYISGRKDNQVKVMGYRIELEEIESAIMELSAVDKVVVLFDEKDEAAKLIAIVQTNILVKEEELFMFMKKKLPHYMIPRSFVFVDQIPHNANGKVDRKSLAKDWLIKEEGAC